MDRSLRPLPADSVEKVGLSQKLFSKAQKRTILTLPCEN
ncbi:hypothetical protein [Pseudomonas phage PfAC05]|nr:hypothetical protein [Pseudomonas phage PfAC05]